MASLKVERTINASIGKVWSVLSEFGKAPGPSIQITLVKEGDPEGYGVGCERIVKLGGNEVHERIEEVDPPESFSYVILSGAPVKHYLGTVELFEKDGVTEINWSGEFVPKLPGTAWIIERESKKVINAFIDELDKIE
ncbi:MAG: SRPBCC family protein [Pseudomonadota bacterium]